MLKLILELFYNKPREKIYVILVAPCFDKKLEASREESKSGRPVIDLVVSTEELNQFLQPFLTDFFKMTKKETEVCDSYLFSKSLMNPTVPIQHVRYSEFHFKRSHTQFGSSNGYLDYIINSISKEGGSKSIRQKKNKNFLEIEISNPKQNFLFAIVYGFKNLQNMVREMKAKHYRYDYVEAMACPGGCINGGGQIPGLEFNDVEKLLNSLPLIGKEEELIKELIIDEKLLQYKIEPLMKKESIFVKW